MKIAGDPDVDMVIDPSLLGNDAENIKGNFDRVISMRDRLLADMNTEQLEVVWQVVAAVEHSVSTAGKLLSDMKFAGTLEWAAALMRDTATRRDKRSLTESHPLIDMEMPYTFFFRYGEAGRAVYRMLRDAQDRLDMMTDRVDEAVQAIATHRQINTLEKEIHKFTTNRGDALTLNTAQVMELYVLWKREKAQEHLLRGGIVQPKVKSANIRRGTNAILLTVEDISEITKVLTAEQAKIADGLQGLLTGQLADYGNKASTAAYGFKKFTSADYWPIHAAKEEVHSSVEKGPGSSHSIKNTGLAMNTIPHANNALDLSGIFDTFTSHATEMTDYAAWLVPMEDVNRLFNFRYRDGSGAPTGKTVKGILDRVGGTGSQRYWSNLMEDIQNGINPVSDSVMGKLVNQTVGNVKGAAVGANLRVIVQQPTAFFRAAVVLDPSCMAAGVVQGATGGNGWKKALQYAPIARRKSRGGFEISNPLQMKEILFDSRTGLRKLNDAMSSPAAKADAMTWGKLWNACEWQTAKNYKSLTVGGEAFYQETAKLFAEVVDQTQVVDGVLQRSQIMRSGNALHKQATSFMGEPTMSLNMLMRAWDAVRYEQEHTRRGRAIKVLGRVAVALLVTDLINALAQSLVDGLRDDDKDKKYWERFWAAFTGLDGDEETPWDVAVSFVLKSNVADNMNPLGRIPYIKDALSILQGYKVTRMDADVAADLIEAGQTVAESLGGQGSKTRKYAMKELSVAASKMLGISAGNILRDVWGIARSIAVETDNIPLQYEMEKAIYSLSSSSNKGRYMDILFRALELGDIDAYQHITAELVEAGLTDGAAIESAMRERLKKAVAKDPAFTLEQASKDLIGSRETYAAEKEPEEAFGADDLSAAAYQSYTLQRATDYREMADGLEGSAAFLRMGDEERDKALGYAYSLADKSALEDASGGQYEVTTKWMAQADDMQRKGIEEWEYVLFHTAYEMAESTYGRDGKAVEGEAKSDHVRDWLEALRGVTDPQRALLWGSVYQSEW